MAHIHYKFSSKLSYDTVVFDGPNISLTDLKKQIMGREKLRAGDCDLQIINAQTKEEFTEDDGHIPKGSSVIVRRIPMIGGKSSSNSKTNHKERSDVQIPNAFGSLRTASDSSSTRALSFFSKMQLANLAESDVSEEDKIKVMMNQSSCDMMKMNSKLCPVLPENYACYRCGTTGHHIRNCPVSVDKNFEAPPRIKKSTGIPRSFMVEVDDPNIKGVMLTSCGRYAIPAIDAEAYAVGKKEKPPFLPQEQPKCEEKEEPLPDELLCLICRDLLCDAVVIPCCANSYCDDCIRTSLLESENHLCPTCGQSDVSPDTLIANKFLRQAVNNFKKERSCSKGQINMCVTSQSQNTTSKPNPVPIATPSSVQNKIKKPLQSPCTEQESPENKPKLEKSPPSSQSIDCSPTIPESNPFETSSEKPSSQTEQSQAMITNSEELETTEDKSEAIAPSDLVSGESSPVAPSELIPQVLRLNVGETHNHKSSVPTEVPLSAQKKFAGGTEQLQPVCMNQIQSTLDSATRLSGSSTSRDSTCSISNYPAGSLTESSLEQRKTSTSSSSYTSLPATPSPLFPSPPFHTFVPTHHPLTSYLPGYPPTTPAWKLPIPPGTPIPSLCSSSPTPSIPVLISEEWYRLQRNKKERSPHKRSVPHSASKSSKSKSSRSYSGSSSRSGSRSRSRHCSPFSNQKAFHNHSNPSRSFGYKRPRSPTPSSSSSPPSSSNCRSKSSSDHSRMSHHHSKRSALSSHGSKRRGERSSREKRKSLGSKALNDRRCLELERQHYLLWKREYQEWYNKYISSYISQFHQLPFPPPPPPPPPPYTQDSYYLKQEGDAVRKGDRSPTSEDSSRSPPSHSSNDHHSPIRHPSGDSCSSKAHDCHSSPAHSSNDQPSMSLEIEVQPKDHLEEGNEKNRNLTHSSPKSSEKVNLQETITGDNLQTKKKDEDCSAFKKEPKKKKSEKSPSSDSSGSINVLRQDKRRRITEPSSCKDDPKVKHTSVKPLLKPDECLDKVKDKRKEETNLKRERGSKKVKNSEKKHKVQPITDTDRLDTKVHPYPEGSKTHDSKSERDRKRKKQDEERNSKDRDILSKTKSGKCLQPKSAEKPKSVHRESLKPSGRGTQSTKKESPAAPLTKQDIWEGGVKMISQKKISININLDGKKKDDKIEEGSSSLGICTEEGVEFAFTEEKLEKENKKTEVNEKEEPNSGPLLLERPSLFQEIRESDINAVDMEIEIPRKDGEDQREEGDMDLWHCALKELKDSKETGKEEEAVREDDGCRGPKLLHTQVDRGSVGRENKDGTQKEEADSLSSQRSKTKKPLDEQNDTSEHSSVYGWRQERTARGKLLEEEPNACAEVTQHEPTLVPRIKWEKKEKDSDKSEKRAGQPPETRTDTESVGDNKQKSLRSTERGRDGIRVTVEGRGQEKRKNSASSGRFSAVAPSGGSEQERDKGRIREQERREQEISKQRLKDEERKRDPEVLLSKRNMSSSHSSSHFSVSKDGERKGLSRESVQSYFHSRTSSRSTFMPDQHSAKRHREEFLDFESKDKNSLFDYNYHYPTGDYSYKDRPLGAQHSPPTYSHHRDRGTHSYGPPAGSYRSFTDWELMQSKSRDESRVQKGEKPGKEKNALDRNRERENPEAVGGRGGGSWKEENPQRLEERRRSSSSSSSSVRSSASRRSSRD
ncbi:E3 ubiquitin-protein ligase RBBP6-like isoform X1 [Cyprinodon tularosa]|uniref:E3 ubiquitin-protein ligase RBBP6-like isoform X1 n=2 Tax=Cyprinodon tularosa TaxID=77115 RepID=UPI0018E28D91|nr:E3 ubiquitin-protein ligase RBBP6-like isoform X1 [Cyprinodon tularosa]